MYRRDQRPYSLVFRVAKTLQAAGAEAALATEEEANQKLKEGWNRIIRPSIKEIERYRYYTILCYMYNDIHLDCTIVDICLLCAGIIMLHSMPAF